MAKRHTTGFTIVELLIVIVVIAILASIVIVSYSGIQNQARESSLKSDLQTAAIKVELYKVQQGSYPLSLEDAGVSRSTQNTIAYITDSSTYCINGTTTTSGTVIFHTSQDGTVQAGGCATTPENCFAFNSATKTITNYYFGAGCPRSVNIPPTIGGVAVQAIGDEAFTAMGMTGAIIPDSVKTVGVSAFDDNRISSLTLSRSLTTVATNAFRDNWLVSVTIPSSVTSVASGAFVANNMLKTAYVPNGLVVTGVFDSGISIIRY